MRKLIPVAFAVLLLLAGCVTPLQTDGGSAAGDNSSAGASDAPTITVSGTGESVAEADLAVLYLSVTSTADTADAARGDVATRSQQLVDALADAGIDTDADVETVSYSIQPQYNYAKESRELTGYRAVHTFRVEVAPDRAGDIVDAAVQSSDALVDGVQFTLTDETREQVRAEALDDAVVSARSDADALANSTGLSITGVHSVSTSDSGGIPYARYESAAADAGGSTEFQPGPVTVSVSVTVTYTAE